MDLTLKLNFKLDLYAESNNKNSASSWKQPLECVCSPDSHHSNLTANTIVLRGEAVGWGEGWTHKGFSVQIWRPGFDFFLEEDEEKEELQLGIYNHNTGEA